MQDISTAHTRLVVPTNGAPIGFDYKMVTLPANWVTAPTENSALIAVNGSGSGDVLLHDVEAHRGRFEALGELADAEENLPRQQVREQSRRRRKQRVLRQKRPDVGTERSTGKVLRVGERRRREREEVVEIGGDSLLRSAFQSLPSAHDHD